MVMARKKEKKEKDILDQILDTIDFRRLTQDEVVGQPDKTINRQDPPACTRSGNDGASGV